MAIKLEDKQNVNAPNATFPFGDVKDNSGANDGTPLNRAVLSDYFQFFAKLLGDSGIVANDLLESDADGFQYIEALVDKIEQSVLAGVDIIPTNAIQDDAVDNDKIADGSIDGPKIVNGEITLDKMDNNSVDSDQYVDGSIDDEHLAEDRVKSVGVQLLTKTVEIGDWDMDTDGIKAVAHGIGDHKKIRGISVIIRDDIDTNYSDLKISGGVLAQNIQSVNIGLTRDNAGSFDNPTFDSTGFNRGWLTITYEA